MKEKHFKVEGMSCGHCVMAVRKEISKLDKVKINDVRIGSVDVAYNENEINDNQIKQAIEEAGYIVIE